MHKEALAVIADMMTALSNCALYSREHSSVKRFAQKAVSGLENLYVEDAVTFTILGSSLLVQDRLVQQWGIHVGSFMTKLRRKGIERLVLRRGVDAEELTDFLQSLASRNEEPSSSRHISLGVMEIKAGASAGAAGVVRENTERVKHVHQGLAHLGTLDTAGLEDVVVSFLGAIRKESNILAAVSPVKSHNEYTFAHTANVTVLSIFQAEYLGVEADTLHEVGLAGLLHDIGKMFVDPGILDKPSKLTEDEWEKMKLHPVYGARYLASLQEVPKLAVIVAFEHHMKYDGSGYPRPGKAGWKQHIISQIVALADFFDALRTERPYRKALEVPVILGMMEESAGRDFNPLVVENFVRALKECGAA
ncbi:MAG: HD domain-containing protein [Nitrospirota bacterium]